MREKLIELLEDRRLEASEVCGSMNKGFGAWYADHLIANGIRLEEKQATSNEASKWISVNDRLPETHQKVLMCSVIGNQYVAKHYNGHFYVDGLNIGASHWMPLPEPPKGE